jgi:hypothetical protein
MKILLACLLALCFVGGGMLLLLGTVVTTAESSSIQLAEACIGGFLLVFGVWLAKKSHRPH